MTAASASSRKALSKIACNRLQKELVEWQVNPPTGFKHKVTDNLQRWIIEVNGVPGTLYAGETYQLQVDFPEHYPMEAPQICNGDDKSPANKRNALQQLIEVSIFNYQSIWSKYFNQILTSILEVLDDSDSSIHEMALAMMTEMFKNQKVSMEDSIEIVIEKLLHATKDSSPKFVF